MSNAKEIGVTTSVCCTADARDGSLLSHHSRGHTWRGTYIRRGTPLVTRYWLPLSSPDWTRTSNPSIKSWVDWLVLANTGKRCAARVSALVIDGWCRPSMA